MSEYKEITTEFTDEECLIGALQDMGWTPDQIITGPDQVLYGYRGDARKERADIRIPKAFVGRAANDIGFAKQPDGSYRAIISAYDRAKHNDQWMGKLTAAYAERKVTKDVARHRRRIVGRQTQQDGTIVLRIRR